MKSEVMVGNKAVAYAVKLARTRLVSAYPITPQTTIVQYLSDMVASGELDAEFVNVEGEITAQLVCMAASITGARAFTATSGPGLLYMHHALHGTARYRLPVVMAVANRGVRTMGPDHTDLMAQRDTGWIQLYCENNQEVLDTGLMAFKIAEDERVRLPVAFGLDGYVLSYTAEPVIIPDQEQVDEFLPPCKGNYPVLPESFDAELEKYKRHWGEGKRIDEPFTPFPADECFSHLTMVKWGAGHDLQWRWRSHQEAMERAKKVIKEVDEEYGRRFGRSYGGLVEEYRCEGAEAVIVAMGTIASTAKAAIDRIRGDGKPVGLVKLKAFRPFPSEEFARIGESVKAIGVLDRNISLGEGGVAFNSIRSAVYGLDARPAVHGYHVGLAGNEVRVRDITRIAERTLKAARGEKVEPLVTWV
ncbi:pyruvate ferredoxin oxidoreductase [Candidatus Bathyarchaeota archaeon]|nr:pyruvate ferredoxin oxidoreductase [Candidatus Bathyarchaeota archaeon]